jgi:site-specific DNA-adenine methylase
MSLIFFSYVGSKSKDLKFYEKNLPDPQNIKISIEPFGGSGYTSLYLFSKNDKIKSIINDTDEVLINFFNQLKTNFDVIIDSYNKLIEQHPSKEQFKELVKEYKENKGDNLRRAILFLFLRKFHGITYFLYPMPQHKIGQIDKTKYEILKNWLKNTEFNLKDYTETFNDIKKLKNNGVFVFLDPPYLDSYNAYYSDFKDHKDKDNNLLDNTKMYIDIAKFLKSSSKNIIFIINKNSITEYLYNDCILDEYNKMYSLKKRNKAVCLIIGKNIL